MPPRFAQIGILILGIFLTNYDLKWQVDLCKSICKVANRFVQIDLQDGKSICARWQIDLPPCTNRRRRHRRQLNSIQFNTIQSNPVQFNPIQYNSIQSNSIPSNSVQFNSIQIDPIQSNSVQFNASHQSNSIQVNPS